MRGSQVVRRWVHIPEILGSIPSPATILKAIRRLLHRPKPDAMNDSGRYAYEMERPKERLPAQMSREDYTYFWALHKQFESFTERLERNNAGHLSICPCCGHRGFKHDPNCVVSGWGYPIDETLFRYGGGAMRGS